VSAVFMGIVVSCVSFRRPTSPTAWRLVPLLQMCLPKSRDFRRSTRTPSGRSRLRRAKAAGWRRRWPPWRPRRRTSGASWWKKGGRPTRPSSRCKLAEAKLARAEGSLASQRAEEWEVRFNALRGRVETTEASTRSAVERTRAQLVDSYRELGARTADFEVPDREAGLRFLEWLQEELLVLPTIVEGFMSFASLVTYEGAMNALSREGCRHYEVFDQADESFEREIFKAEDPVVK
jgi:hypothetical protein